MRLSAIEAKLGRGEPVLLTQLHSAAAYERFLFLSSLFVSAHLWLPGTLAAAPAAVPIEAGVAQLFIDDFLIDAQSGLKRTLRQPRKDDDGSAPVIALASEASLMAKGTIVYDPRLERYVMFAKARPSTSIYRFTSADGLHWSSDRDTPGPLEIDQTNPATGRREGYGGMHSFYYDAGDARHPYKGWAYFGNWGNECEGVYYIRSADGRKWERGGMVVNGYAGPGDSSCREIHQGGRVVYGPGDVTFFYHDPVRSRFLGIFKFFTTEKVGPGNALRSRAYAFLDRIDQPFDTTRITRIALLPPAAHRDGDMPWDEYYASTAWRYESLWLGGLKVWHGGGDYPYSAAGCAFLKLVVSRDGLHWQKIRLMNDAGVPEVFIPNGPEGGNHGRNDGGYMSEFSQGPLRIGDELIYYYGCTSYGKNHPRDIRVSGGGIFRARLRIDGFVSVDGGTLTTRPLAFEGRDLFVNGIGPIFVEVLDVGRKALGATSLSGDSLRHAVTFKGKSLRQLAPGGVARLRFTVADEGELYAFVVRRIPRRHGERVR